MIRHGVFWCPHCGYRCPVKAGSEFQQETIDAEFYELTRDVPVRPWLDLL